MSSRRGPKHTRCSTGPNNCSSCTPCTHTSPSPLCFQHQRAVMAPAGWPPASYFLPHALLPFILIQAPSGLSGPMGYNQRDRSWPLPGHLRPVPQNGGPLSRLLSDGLSQKADKAKCLETHPFRFAEDTMLFLKHGDGWLKRSEWNWNIIKENKHHQF